MAFNIVTPPSDLKSSTSSAYYKEKHAVDFLPVVLKLLTDEQDLYLKSDTKSPNAFLQKVSSSWKYLRDHGPEIVSLKTLGLPWDKICNSKNLFVVKCYSEGVMISKKKVMTNFVESPRSAHRVEMKNAKTTIKWEPLMFEWLEKESPKEPFLLENLSLTDEEQEKALKILSGLENLQANVTNTTLEVWEEQP